MALVDLKTDLKSLKFESGLNRKPFVVKDTFLSQYATLGHQLNANEMYSFYVMPLNQEIF